MSRERKSIELEAPDVQGFEVERMESHRHTCNYCNGFGYAIGSNDRNERDYVKCPVCHGTGKMMAEIAITWKPEENTNN